MNFLEILHQNDRTKYRYKIIFPFSLSSLRVSDNKFKNKKASQIQYISIRQIETNHDSIQLVIKMKIREFILLAILIIHIMTDTVSLSDLLQTTKKCTDEGNCSQAKTFAGESDFKDFTDKYVRQQTKRVPSSQVIDMTFYKPGRPPSINPSVEFPKIKDQQIDDDQADIIKTDGTYLYFVSNNQISIVHANPAKQEKIPSIEAEPHKQIQGLFVWKNVLAVFSTEGKDTFVFIYDVTNKNNPKMKNSFSISGKYFCGRMLDDGFMYLISKSAISYQQKIIPWYNPENTEDGQLNFSWSWIYWNPSWDYHNPLFINIAAFDLKSPHSNMYARSFIGEQKNILYMYEQNIYLAKNTNGAFDQTRISKIVVSRKYIRPIAFETLRGSYKNQSSFSEFEGNLRVAITIFKEGYKISSVYVLGPFLQVLGSIHNIAQFYEISICRYVNSRLYIAVSRAFDPFFVIDLSNPSKPQLLGQLIVPNYSTYIQPYDENTVICFGRELNSPSVKIGIFDATDVGMPIQTDQFAISSLYTYPLEDYEPKAYLLAPNKNLLVFPVQYNDYTPNGTFNGAFSFFVSPNQIELQSRIDHLNGSSLNDYWKNRVHRSIYIQNLLYTKSSCKIIVTDLENLQNVQTIPLGC